MRGHIRKRGATYEVIVDAGKDPVTGRRRQISRTAKTKAGADDLLLQLLVEIGRGVHLGSRSTFLELLHRWEEHASPSWSPSTRLTTRSIIRAHLAPTVGGVPLHKLQAHTLDGMYAQLSRDGKSASTVRRVHVVVRRSLAQAVRWQLIPENPAVHASPPSVRRTEIVPPNPEDVRRILAKAVDVDQDLAVYLRVNAATGARRGEVLGLRWSSLDVDARTLRFDRGILDAGPGVGIVHASTKTKSSTRVISVDDGTVQMLRAHRARMAERALAAGVPLSEGGYVFSYDPDGARPWRPDSVGHRYSRLRASLGLQGVRLHDLRHFVATRMIDGGVPLPTVSRVLGHSRQSTTSDVYAHAIDARDAEAAEVMGRLLG